MGLLAFFVAVIFADHSIAIAIEFGKEFFCACGVFGASEEFFLADRAVIVGIALLQLLFSCLSFAMFAFAFFFRLNVGAASDKECE